MGGLEYWFGTGDGTTHTWFSEPDLALGGGQLDAVALDFDGDGLLDDAMWDRNWDGIVDTAVLDRDAAPQHYSDPSRRGVWDVAVEVTAEPTGVEWTDRDGRPQHAAGDRAPIDYDGDGHQTDAVLDVDHDGHADAILIGGEPNRYRALYPLPDLGAVDTDADGFLDAITTDPPDA
ncbi:MAG TPA: hypothetical protein VIW24_14575 [Aldersonia sp.]